MRNAPITRTIAIAGLAVALEAGAANTYDDATRLLTLDAVTLGGATYTNVTATVHAYALLGVGSGTPGATRFDPASGVLTLGSVTYGGVSYTNVTARIDAYALLGATAPSQTRCAPLGAPANTVINVSSAAELVQAVADANGAGGNRSILLADGDYVLAAPLVITAPDVTVRGASANRGAVTVQGGGMNGSVMHVFLVRASRFTVADLTLGRVANHGIQIQGERDADDLLVHNVRFIDTREQMLKVSYDASDTSKGSDRGIVECSEFEYTAGVGPQYYIGGIDAHNAGDWVVRDNVFKAIRSPDANLAEHAIHFWSGSSDTLVERNTIINSDRGIGFGLGSRGHVGGTIRNNMVHTTRDVGIGLESASGARVLNNSVYAAGYPNAIEYRFAATTGAYIANNLTYGTIKQRDGAMATLVSNNTAATAAFFVDPANGDLRLASAVASVVDMGLTLSDVTDDIDMNARPIGGAPDIGAHEWGTP